MNFNTVMSTEIDAQGEHCSANCELAYNSGRDNVLSIQRAWKTECRPTKEQERLLWAWCGASRRVYNWALRERLDNFTAIAAAKAEGVEKDALPRKLTKFDQGKALTTLIRDDDPLGIIDIPCAVREYALADLDMAFQHFFRKMKARQCQMKRGAKKAMAEQYGAPENWPKLDGVDLWSKLQGWPRFKSVRDFSHSFRTRRSINSDGYSVKIPRMQQPLRLKERLYFPDIPSDDINSVTVSWNSGRWYLSMQADWMLELPENISDTEAIISFDVPHQCRIICDGAEEIIHEPRPYALEVSTAATGEILIAPTDPLYRELKKLRRMSREFSRKLYDPENKTESKRRAAHRLKLQQFHAKIARQREYQIHNLSTDIVRRFGKITVIKPDLTKKRERGRKRTRPRDEEKLDHLLASDASWGEFIRQLKYKSAWHGVVYEEDGGDEPGL